MRTDESLRALFVSTACVRKILSCRLLVVLREVVRAGNYFIGAKVPPRSVLEFTLFGHSKIRPMTAQELRSWELLDQLSVLTNEDEWWFWKRIGERDALDSLGMKLDKQRMDLYLNSFEGVFDNGWWSTYCKKQRKGAAPDPLGTFGGQSPIKRILRIGECIHALRDKRELPDNLVERLKNKKSFRAASAEIEIATCFIQAGFELYMYPTISTGSTPEGKVIIEGVGIYYEVTEQHWSNYELEVMRRESRVIDWLSKKCGPVDGSILFKSEKDSPARKVGEMVALLRTHYKRGSLAPLPFQFENADFKVYIGRSETNGGWVGISGLEPTPEEIVRRWVAQLFRKARQLPPKESGVIIGSPSFLWGPEDVEAALNEIQAELGGGSHRRVSGIILCAKHVENSGFIKPLPHVVINPNALVDNAERIGKMAEALFRFPDWF